ncbi:branched-chain amino acid transport system II carrier protein [Candidatus Dependentiae bacterium]|nr:branched-chain amino acid transport system II carrier protein [Candidatus Dependentiae bacterium]
MRLVRSLWRSDTVATGLAIFSMFFGAGNVVFPLVIGRYAGDKNIYAVIGFLLSAVLVPFIGLVSMVLFDGDYKKFFCRLGKIPGTFIIFFLMALIGPFAAIPRCIALSFTTVKSFLPGVTLFYFSFISCFVIYLLAMKKSKVVGVLGRVLSPILLVSLAVIIIKGFWSGLTPEIIFGRRRVFFLEGLVEGYNTMDIFAAFFFSAVVIAGLKQRVKKKNGDASQHQVIWKTLKAGTIGISLLGIIYAGFSCVSSFYGERLGGIEPDALISSIAYYTLGSYAGIIACLAVSLACLTTAIALSVVFSEFFRTEVLRSRMGYRSALLVSMAITFAVSNIGFAGIVKIILPVLVVIYPPLIILAFVNIAYKLWGVQIVKLPVYTTFFGVVMYRLLQAYSLF